MIKLVDVDFPEDVMYITKEKLMNNLIESLAEGMVGHQNDAFYFFTNETKNNYGIVDLTAKAVNKQKYDKLVKELIDEEMVFPNFVDFTVEEGLEDLYKNRIVDTYSLFKLVNLDKLAKLMIKNKCSWIFSADAYNDFNVDLADIDWTEVEKPAEEYNIGDSVKVNGRVGIVEDYDDEYYYVRDDNTNIVKIKKVNDRSRLAYEYEPEEDFELEEENSLSEKEQRRIEAEKQFTEENSEEEDVLKYFREKNLSNDLNKFMDEFLTEKEKKVLELSFGLNGEKPHTENEIGEKFNVTASRIHAIKQRALNKLKYNNNIVKKQLSPYLYN